MLNTPTLRKQLLTAALLACLGAGAAVAQTTPATPADKQARMQEHFARMQARMAQHLADLKAKLAITPGQEAAWNAWVAAITPPAPGTRPAHPDLSTLTTPQRIDRMRAMRAERQGAMDKRADATLAFYATLTAPQKQTFDTETARMFRHGGRGGRGGHGHHG